MPYPPPIWDGRPTDEIRSWIAGYLVHHREGTLKALDSYRQVLPRNPPEFIEPYLKYYQDAEAYSRFLLYWLGYPVAKDSNYVPPKP